LNTLWTIQYDGTDYNGWQRQPVQEGVKTIEGTLEGVLSIILQRDVEMIGQGRTDAGVHALGQTAHCALEPDTNVKQLMYSVNQMLPDDIRIVSVEQVDPDTHARFDATTRTYEYHITTEVHALKQRFAMYAPWLDDLAILRLQNMAKAIQKVDDFAKFAKMDEDTGTHCAILQAEWTRSGTDLVFRVEANRFLRHMVRRLVGTMIDFASLEDGDRLFSGFIDSSKVSKTDLASMPKHATTAEAKGLVLTHVKYIALKNPHPKDSQEELR
jgi:tRNA pseudouridine38-40 synthase